jgi:hypothetical protein
MPINIYKEESYETIALISENNWNLPNQIDDFEKWLFSIGKNLPYGKYIADIGFDIRKDASGGGAVINLKMIKILAKIGMEIYLSEYPKTN